MLVILGKFGREIRQLKLWKISTKKTIICRKHHNGANNSMYSSDFSCANIANKLIKGFTMLFSGLFPQFSVQLQIINVKYTLVSCTWYKLPFVSTR